MGRIAGALLCVGMLALAMVGIGNLSCYSAPNPACGFLCNSDNGFACPTEYTCSQAAGVCVSNSAPVGMHCYGDAAPAPEGIDGDPTAPQVVSTSPENGATLVEPGMPIEIQFSQPMAINTVNPNTVQLLDVNAGTPLSYTFTLNSTTLTLTPTLFFVGGDTIEVTLEGLTNATPLRVPLATTSFAFATRDDISPALVLSDPLDHSTAVPVTTTIVATFSEPVTGVDINSFVVFQGATQQAGTLGVNIDATQWTFTPTAALPAASVITVTLTTAIHDLSANPLTATQFSFTTQ
jgi:hypothetical protein